MIKSILDTDLYKFSMSYSYMKLYPLAEGCFEFIDRNKTIYNKVQLDELRSEFCNLSHIHLTKDELEFMCNGVRYIPRHYWEWLKTFNFDPNKIKLSLTSEGYLNISVTDFIYKATLYEIAVLATVSEYSNKGKKWNAELVEAKTIAKANFSNVHQISFSDFGSRRRFNSENQDIVNRIMSQKAQQFNGTSNCYYAMKYNLKMIGTMAHEYIMFHGAQYGYRQGNYKALEAWSDTYDGDLGIALTDTYTSKLFFENFSKKQAKLYDGIRHDSGDPFKFVNDAIFRYKELGIDPISKTIVFSDGLNLELCKEINEYCKTRIKCAFGIGTNLTNDTGNKPCNIVMKLTSCRITPSQPWYNCVKLSDNEGKHTGKPEEIELCLKTLNIK